MGFRENLKEELAYQDIKVKELAEMTGISKHTLDHYLARNGSQPQAELAVKIARALNTSVEYLVCGKEQSKKNPLKESLSGAIMSEIEHLSDEDLVFLKRLVQLMRMI